MFSLIIIKFHVQIYWIRIYYFQAGVSQTVKSTKTKTCIPVFISKTVVLKKSMAVFISSKKHLSVTYWNVNGAHDSIFVNFNQMTLSKV